LGVHKHQRAHGDQARGPTGLCFEVVISLPISGQANLFEEPMSL